MPGFEILKTFVNSPKLLFEALSAFINFFRNPKNQHLATWLQTFAVLGGVVVGLYQLNTVLRQEEIKSNERYLEIEKKFSSDISRKMGMLHEHYINRERLNDQQYSKLYSLEDILNTRRDVEVFISDLSSCGTLEVCPKRIVDSTVCTHSKHLHELLSKDLNLPGEWKIKFKKPVFYENMINQHCGVFDIVYYWWQWRA